MPPRGAAASSRGGAQRRMSRGQKPVRGRGRGGRGGRKSRVEVPPPEPAQPIEPPKPELPKWLRDLPPVIKPDEELHQKLSLERRQKRSEKVLAFCRNELEGIFNYAFLARSQAKSSLSFAKSRSERALRAEYRSGKMCPPEPTTPEVTEHAEALNTYIRPLFTLETDHYLKCEAETMWSDLGSFFGCSLMQHDPNSIFDQFMTHLIDNRELFEKPYAPFRKMPFPFTVGVIGPAGSGRTTVCQFLQKIFQVTIIEVLPPLQKEDSVRRKKKDDSNAGSHDVQKTYPLAGIVQYRASDDKTTAKALAQMIIDQRRESGVILVGFPNTKAQLQMIEKAAASLVPPATTGKGSGNTSSRSNSESSGKKKDKEHVFLFSGFIVTTFANQDRERMVDPVTGNVYQNGFHWPGFMDLIGVLPTEFPQKQREIVERLEEVIVPDFVTPTNKVISTLVSFETSLRKNYNTIVIPKCERSRQVFELLDEFLKNLFKTSDCILVPNALVSLSNPSELIMPGLCHTAMRIWKECTESFGKTIAEVWHLINTLNTKLQDVLTANHDRFALMTALSDARIELFKKTDVRPSDLFNTIWEISLSRRNENLEYVDAVVKKSGLIELLVELRKAPKLVVLSLIRRLFFVKWFNENYGYLATDEELSQRTKFLETMIIEMTPIPVYDFQIDLPPPPSVEKSVVVKEHVRPQTSRPVRANDETEFQRRAGPGTPTTKTKKIFHDLQLIQDTTVHFDHKQVCEKLGISEFESSVKFETSAFEFGVEFFDHLISHLTDECLIEECNSSKKVFLKFANIVKAKDEHLTCTITEMRQAHNTYTYQKCSHEMENFSKNFREWKKNERETPLFEYDFSQSRAEISDLIAFVVKHNAPLLHAQSIISSKAVLRVAERAAAQKKLFVNLESFLGILNESAISQEDKLALDVSARVLTCVECFNIRKLLAHVAGNTDDRDMINCMDFGC